MRKYLIGLSIICYALSALIMFKALVIITEKPNENPEVTQGKRSLERTPTTSARHRDASASRRESAPVVAVAPPPEQAAPSEPPSTSPATTAPEERLQSEAQSPLPESGPASEPKIGGSAKVTVLSDVINQNALVLGEQSGLDPKVSDLTANQEIMEMVNQLAPLVLASPDANILVEGHTDNTPLVTTPGVSDNKELSYLWAKTVAEQFLRNGVAQDRVMMIGYGDTKPVAANDSDEGRMKNRRVVIKLITHD